MVKTMAKQSAYIWQVAALFIFIFGAYNVVTMLAGDFIEGLGLNQTMMLILYGVIAVAGLFALKMTRGGKI